MQDDELLLLDDVVENEQPRLSRATWYREMAAGRIAYYRIAGRRYVTRRDLADYLNRCRVPAAS